MQDGLLSAIDIFYDCANNGFDYHRAIDTFSKSVDDTGICLSEISLAGRINLLGYANIPEMAVTVMTTTTWDAESHGVFKHYASVPEGVPVLRRSIQSDEEHFKSRMYLEASAPWGLHSEGGSILRKGLMGGIMYGFVRLPGQNAIDHEILARMAVLNSHLSRAMRLQRQLGRLEEALVQASNVLDLVEFGLLLYDSKGKFVFANIAAQRILDARDGIYIGSAGPALHDTVADQQYQAHLDALTSPEIPLAARAGAIIRVRRTSWNKPYSLMIVPMPGKGLAGMDNAGVAVFLFDPATRRTTAISLFSSSYGLTRSEAILALDLAQGVSLDDFASGRGLSRNTVKSQLHSIFAKTETSRQPELVSLLLRSVAGISLG